MNTAANIVKNKLTRYCVTQTDPTVLSRIYDEQVNMSVWKRNNTKALQQSAQFIINEKPTLQLSSVITANNIEQNLIEAFGTSNKVKPLIKDISQLVDMFCCLFDLKQAGIRITVLNKAMCPRFHVDRVPSRLITTYEGSATQWIAHDNVDRSILNIKDKSLVAKQNIQQLNAGDVALLKGEIWDGNEGAGLVHRSPALKEGEQRLLLTLDCIYD